MRRGCRVGRYQEGGAGPGHGRQGAEVGRLLQNHELLLADGQDLVHEGLLPGVQLQHLDPVQDLVHQLNTRVLVPHLLHLGEGGRVREMERRER